MQQPGVLTAITLSDLIPGGFKYVKDSADLVRAGNDGELGTSGRCGSTD